MAIDFTRRNTMLPEEIDPTRQTAGGALPPLPPAPAVPGAMTSPAQRAPVANLYPPAAPSPPTNLMMPPAAVPGSLESQRINPWYMPANFNYQDTPEFQNQLNLGLQGANRRLLASGRSDSTGGANILNRFEGDLRAQEIKDNWQRAYMADQANWGRYLPSSQENYARQFGEGAQDWNRNWQLAQMGYGATQYGVGAGTAAAGQIANMLRANGADQASLALESGTVSSEMIEKLLNMGFTYLQIEGMARSGQLPRAPNPNVMYGAGALGPGVPGLPAYDASGIGNPYSFGQPQNAAVVPSWLLAPPTTQPARDYVGETFGDVNVTLRY